MISNCMIMNCEGDCWISSIVLHRVFLFIFLQYCYKLIQLFRITCFIAGQYNTDCYGAVECAPLTLTKHAIKKEEREIYSIVWKGRKIKPEKANGDYFY